jgi:hypothetical protein
MSVRAIVSIASILGLLVTAAAAQQPETASAASASSALTNPPVFQGLMVDAKGKTVGLLFPDSTSGVDYIVRQLNKIWVQLPIDPLAGFPDQSGNLRYVFQSVDCAGQGYFLLNWHSNYSLTAAALPALGLLATIPPSTQPSIYFAGAPVSKVTIGSFRYVGDICRTPQPDDPLAGQPVGVGPAQSVPLSSLGLTLPFSVK